jgi:hypothetical protein
VNRKLPKAVQYTRNPKLSNLGGLWSGYGGMMLAGGYGASKLRPHEYGYENEYDRSLRDISERSQQAYGQPSYQTTSTAGQATGGQTARTPKYNYGEASQNARPPGYGYMTKVQSTKYAGLLRITEKRAQDITGNTLADMAINMGMYAVPGLGTGLAARDTVSSAKDIVDRLRAGQYGRAALSGLGTLGNAAVTALTLAPGGGILARLAKGLKMGGRAAGAGKRLVAGMPKPTGISESIGHELGRLGGVNVGARGGKALATAGRTMQSLAPDRRFVPALTWGGIPAAVVGGAGPGMLDAIEERNAQPPPEPSMLDRISGMFGSSEKPRIDYDTDPYSTFAGSPLWPWNR